MLVTIVRLKAPAESPDDPSSLVQAAAPAYQQIPGLRRKYFIGNAEFVGGVYEWDNREAAEAWFDADWRQRMASTYGQIPTVEYFEAPCLVDNVTGEVLFADGTS